MSNIDRREEKINEAHIQGHDIVYANDYLLTLDFDDCNQPPSEIYEKIDLLDKWLVVGKVNKWRSKSGTGWHMTLQLCTPITFDRRIALQAILGSDWKREMLTLLQRDWNNTSPPEPFLIQPGLVNTVKIYREKAGDKR